MHYTERLKDPKYIYYITNQYQDLMSTEQSALNPQSLSEISIGSLMQKLFQKHDRDGDGRLSKFEFIQILRTLSSYANMAYPNREDMNDLFSQIDWDGDNTITKKQFEVLTSYIRQIFEDKNIKFLYSGDSSDFKPSSSHL